MVALLEQLKPKVQRDQFDDESLALGFRKEIVDALSVGVKNTHAQIAALADEGDVFENGDGEQRQRATGSDAHDHERQCPNDELLVLRLLHDLRKNANQAHATNILVSVFHQRVEEETLTLIGFLRDVEVLGQDPDELGVVRVGSGLTRQLEKGAKDVRGIDELLQTVGEEKAQSHNRVEVGLLRI